MASVVWEGVSKSFGEVKALHELMLSAEEGEFLVLVGPSGCGKTTALRILAGLEEPSAGVVRIGGEVVNDLPPRKRNVAMVFQSYALYPHMNVYDNLAFGLRLRGVPKSEIDQRTRETAAILRIEDLLKRRPRELSGGQRQRVALGRAIVREPRVFLMDEPLSNLDAQLRAQTRAELKKLHHRLNTTFVYVTHDQVEAMTLGTRVAILNRGVLQQAATPQEVYDYPANVFVARFIGSPGMNFFRGRIVSEGSRLMVDLGEFKVPLPPERAGVQARLPNSSEVILGVRPHHFRLAEPGNASAVHGQVELVEPLGSETLVHVRSKSHQWTVSFPGSWRVEQSGAIALTIEPAGLHLFDARTEEALFSSQRTKG